MAKVYNQKDIKDFLLSKGIVFIDEKEVGNNADDVIYAYVKNIDDDTYYETEAMMKVDELNFKIYQEKGGRLNEGIAYSYPELIADYSIDWTVNLLSLYPEIAQKLIAKIETKMENIHNTTQKTIEPMMQEIISIREKERQELHLLENLRKLAVKTNEKQNKTEDADEAGR